MEEDGGWEDDEDDEIGEAKNLGEGGRRRKKMQHRVQILSSWVLRAVRFLTLGAQYTPFPAHQLDTASTLHFASSSFRRVPSLFLLYSPSPFLQRFSLLLPSSRPPLLTCHVAQSCNLWPRVCFSLALPFVFLLFSLHYARPPPPRSSSPQDRKSVV